jgi:hypothetical protein
MLPKKPNEVDAIVRNERQFVFSDPLGGTSRITAESGMGT